MTLLARTAAAALLALLLVPAGAAVGASAAPPPQVERRLSSPRNDPFPRFVDDTGRHVLLRGVNVNQLGQYYTDNPANPSTIPLTESDFARIAALGFNVVRLILNWSALEPTPGAFDASYLTRIREAVGWARAHDTYVILDMHQDAWGPHIATPPGTVCPPGMEGNVGWDGAPAWATFTDGLTTCRLEAREISPAVAQAFQSFWLDRDGIQTHLVATWGRLAREFAAEPAIAGYDLLNEPNPGYTIGVTGATLLGLYYDRAIGAIRAAERSVPGGFAHTVFFEPTGEWSLLGVAPVPLPVFTSDANLSFAPHLYADSITLDATIGVPLTSITQGFDYAEAAAAVFGVPVFSGEWGWFGDPASAVHKVAAYAREEDGRLISGTWWSWKQACGDPHQIGTPGTPPGAISPSLVRFACPGDHELGVTPEFGTVLSRSYPRAAPGRITALTSDPASGRLDLTGVTATAGALDLWVPDRGLGSPTVSGGVGPPTVSVVPGGWRVAVAVAVGSYRVAVSPGRAPAADERSAATSPQPTLPATGTVPPYAAAAVLAALAVLARRAIRRSQVGR